MTTTVEIPRTQATTPDLFPSTPETPEMPSTPDAPIWRGTVTRDRAASSAFSPSYSPGDGRAIALLRVQCDRSLTRSAMDYARELDEQDLSAAADELRATEEYRRLMDLRPHVRAAQRDLDLAKDALTRADRELTDLTESSPPPDNLIQRLGAARDARQHAQTEFARREQEVESLAPIHARAETECKAKLHAILRRIYFDHTHRENKELQDAFDLFCQDNAERLTAIYARSRHFEFRDSPERFCAARADDVMERAGRSANG